MNFDFYLLGTPDGYDQYPLDNTADIFRSFHNEVKSDTQMTIWRNAELVYYIYIRNLRTAGKNQYFGMAIAINGMYLSHLGNVFSVFEQLCSNIALRGRILKIDKTGKIQFVHSRFVDTLDEIETTVRECRELAENNLHNDLKHLPEEYAVQRKPTTITYDDNFSDSKLHGLLKEYNCIHFTKSEKEGTGYVDMVVTRLYEENRNLKEQYRILNGQKKQYKIVILLLILLLIVGGGLFSLNHYVHLQHAEIRQKNDTISTQSVRIQSQSDTITRQKDENDQLSHENLLLNDTVTLYEDSVGLLKRQLQQRKNEIKDLNDELSLLQLNIDGIYRTIGNTYPILISSVKMGNFNSDGTKETDYGGHIYSIYSSHLESLISFQCFTSGTVFLKMKLYKDNGIMWQDNGSPHDCTRTIRLTSYRGAQRTSESDFIMGGPKGFWPRGTYRIEFWYNDRACLYSGTFNIE